MKQKVAASDQITKADLLTMFNDFRDQIIVNVDNKIEKEFAKQDEKIEARLKDQFTKQDKKFEAKLKKEFAKQDITMGMRLEEHKHEVLDQMKQYRNDVLTRMDADAGKIESEREERAFIDHQLQDHEQRITTLEQV